MIVGCLHVHACGGPLGTARSTQLAPPNAVAFGGMLDDVGDCRVKVWQLETGCPLRRLFEVKLQNYSSAKLNYEA